MLRYFCFALVCAALATTGSGDRETEIEEQISNSLELGKGLAEKGDYQGALSMYLKELGFHRLLADTSAEVVCANRIGRTYLSMWKWKPAFEYFSDALATCQAHLSGTPEEAITHESLGIYYSRRGEYGRALEHFQKSLEIRLDTLGPDNYDVALSYEGVGCHYAELGNYELALEHINKALELRIRTLGSDDRLVARCHVGLAYIFMERGEYEEAKEHLNTALEVYQCTQGPESPETATCYRALGNLYLTEADYDTASGFLRRALSIQQAAQWLPKAELAATWNDLGRLYAEIGDYDSSLTYLEKSMAVRLDLFGSHHPELSYNYENLANVHRGMENYRKALKYCGKCIAIRLKSLGPNHPHVARSYSCMSRIHLDSGDTQNALDCMRRSLDISLGVHGFEHPAVAQCFHDMALGYSQASQYDSALVCLDEGIKSIWVGDRSARLTDSVSASDLRHLAITVQLLRTKADIMLGMRDDNRCRESACNMLAAAGDVAGWLREEALSEATELRWGTELHEVNGTLISILAELGKHEQRPEKIEEAFRRSEQSRARVFLDQLGVSRASLPGIIPDHFSREELRLGEQLVAIRRDIDRESARSPSERQEPLVRNLYNSMFACEESLNVLRAEIEEEFPRYAYFRHPSQVSIEEAQQVLDRQEVLLSYALLPGKTVTWAITPDTVLSFVSPVGEDSIATLIDCLRAELPNSGKTFRKYSNKLYRELVLPVEPDLAPETIVYIVADGPLHLIPFELLWDDSQQQYLVERYKIAYIQSGSALALLRKAPRRISKRNELLAFGDPVYGPSELLEHPIEVAGTPGATNRLRSVYTDRGMDFRRLKTTGHEVDSIRAVLGIESDGPPSINLRLNAREENVKSLDLNHYRYIHFACHGYLGDTESDVIQPSLVLSLVGNDKDDGFLQMSEVYALDLNADMVVLSACETGLGEQVRGEGIVGLTRAFMAAGTPSIVVSLWKVQDQSTAMLMKRFYSNMDNGLSKAEALREAKLALMSDEAGYTSPRYWAPFILVGEWK